MLDTCPKLSQSGYSESWKWDPEVREITLGIWIKRSFRVKVGVTSIVNLRVEAPILWSRDVKSQLIGKDTDAGKDWGQEEKRVTEDETVQWHHQLNGYQFEQTLGDSKDREAWHAAVHRVAKSQTRLSNWTSWNYVGVVGIWEGGRIWFAEGKRMEWT